MSPWLQMANENTDTETGNMQTVVRGDHTTLCLWANLKRNPRFVPGRKYDNYIDNVRLRFAAEISSIFHSMSNWFTQV